MNSPLPPYGYGSPVPWGMNPVAVHVPLRRPRVLDVAFWLTLAGAALFLTVVAILLANNIEGIRDLERDLYAAQGPYTEADVENSANMAVFLYMLFALVASAPFVTFAALLRLGHNWVRILLTVCLSIGGFLSVLLMFPTTIQSGLLAQLLAMVLLAISIAVISLLFTRASNTYFAGPR